MIYTLISKIPFVAKMKSFKFFVIFVLGSIAYLVLHYYLHSSENLGFIDNFKGYFYYLLGVDFMVALTLSRMTSEDEYFEDGEGYTKDQRDKIEKKLLELQEIQNKSPAEAYKQKLQQLQSNRESEKSKEEESQKSPFVTITDAKKTEQKNESNESEKSSVKKKDKSKKSKKTKNIEVDTNIPVYM